MKTPVKVAVAGINGQMGQALVAALNTEPGLSFIGGFGRGTGDDKSVIDRSRLIETADVILDFSSAEAAALLAADCAKRGGPALVIGATGFAPDDLARIDDATHAIPIVRAGNYSIGLNMLTGILEEVAARFPAEAWDVEILEAHHRRKHDAPSGTALMLGEAVARGRGVDLADVERRGRDGLTGERSAGEIGFAVLRGGGIVGEHSVLFAANEEVVTFSHSALDRGMFARGALLAARWIIGRPPGAYDMHDVLGFVRTAEPDGRP